MLQPYLVFPCSSLSISLFSKELLFLLLDNGIRNQDLHAGFIYHFVPTLDLNLNFQ